MASQTKHSKKREWGKPRMKEKIVIVENMDLELQDVSKSILRSNLELESACEDRGTHQQLDALQHPEMLATQELVNMLTARKVPLPVCEDGSQSRETLINLFWKHVLPRPQRHPHNQYNRHHRSHQNLSVNKQKVCDWEVMEWEPEKMVDMEKQEKSSDISSSKLPQTRKRKSSQDTTITVSSPPLKKTSLPAPIITPLAVSMATSNTPVRKLKRPTINKATVSVNKIMKTSSQI